MNAQKQYDPKFISDKEVAALLAISCVTVCRRAKLPPDVRLPENEIDLREAEPLYVGRCRRWRKDFILLLANHQPVPTDTWREHHPQDGRRL